MVGHESQQIGWPLVADIQKEFRQSLCHLPTAVGAAKSDGRWQKAYDSQRNSSVPEDFLKALAKSKEAKAFFETLNKSNVYSIVYRLQTAKKPETREKRMRTILEMMNQGEKFHP